MNYLQRKKRAIISMHHSNISSEYEQVGYLESTGTQYIDTEICAQSGLNITIDSEFTSSKWYMTIFGGWDSNSSNRCHLYHHTGREMYYYYAASGYPYYESTDYRNRHTYKINDNILSVDGVTKITNTATSFTSTYNMYIFANNNAGTAANNAYMRLYAFSISKDGNVLRDFIPVLDNNGTACLYDTVTKKYYYNQGTGEFKCGDIITENNEINISINYDDFGSKRINDTFAKNLNLQIINFKDKTVTREEFYNYTKVEYLRTTKTQFLDTKIKYNDNYKIGIDFLVEDTDINDSVICGSKDWNDNRNIVTIERGYLLRNYYPSNPVDYSFGSNRRKQIEIFRGQIIYNNTVQVGDDNINPSAEANAANIHIFSDNDGGHLINYAKLYGFYIYDTITNNYIMNAFPALDSNDIPCLYDAITKKYYYNQGTGEFLFAQL